MLPTIATAAILLNSVSRPSAGPGQFQRSCRAQPDGSLTGTGAEAEFDGMEDEYYTQKPIGIYVPRFRNLSPNSARKDYIRGFGCRVRRQGRMEGE